MPSDAEKAGKLEAIGRAVKVSRSSTGRKKKRRKRLATDFSPTERLKKSQGSDDGKPVLGKRLSAIASGIRPGTGKVSKIISGAVSGAAIGATIGEGLAADRKKKKKRKEDRDG